MAHDVPDNIRNRIHDLMRQRKISRATLVRLVGMDEGAFNQFLSGKSKACPKTADPHCQGVWCFYRFSAGHCQRAR